MTSCEETRERLPEHVLGTLDDTTDLALRRHLRGCAGCRAEMGALGDGLALFAQAAHDAPPPPELEDRVLSQLADEWRDTTEADAHPAAARRGRGLRRLGAAAAVVALVASLSWGLSEHRQATQLASAGDSYGRLLQILGGKEFRAGTLQAAPGVTIDGSVVVYESHEGQSWVAVFARGPRMEGTATATLEAPDGRTVDLWDLEFQADGNGATWLVTASDLASFDRLTLRAADGTLLATARISSV